MVNDRQVGVGDEEERVRGRVAIFHCGFIYSGGGERIVLEEARGLKKRGWQVEVFGPTLEKRLCYPGMVEEVGVRTFLPQLPRFFPLRHAVLMALTSALGPVWALRFRKTDVFLGANQPGAWLAWCVARVLRKPYVVYLNQPNRLLYPRLVDLEAKWYIERSYRVLDEVLKRMNGFLKWADRVSIRGGRRILVNGEYIAKVIRRIYGGRVRVCPGGVYGRKREELRIGRAFLGEVRAGGRRIKKPYVLLTNRHDPQKKFEYAIEAMVRVVRKYPEVRLVIPGPFTSHTPKLVALSRRLGIGEKVWFLGQITEGELQRLYRGAAVYVYPSPEEDFGLGPLEAGAWGVPTVAWNNAGPTVTVKDGETGFLAKPFEVEDYAAKILRLLEDRRLRARMGWAAWRRVKERFSWERHVDVLEEELVRAMEEDGKMV